MVDKGLNEGRVGSTYGEGQRVQAEQLGSEAAPGQSKLEEGGGPRWVQWAGGRQGGEGTETARGEAGSSSRGEGGGQRGPQE